MPSFESVANDIFGGFAAAWSVPNVVVAYPNEPKKSSQPDADDSWLRMTTSNAFGRILGIGETIGDMQGRLVVEIFTPLGSGTQESKALMDEVVFICQGKQLGDARFGAAEPFTVGRDADGRFWKENVAFPFYFETTP